MAPVAATIAVTITTIAIAVFRRFGLASTPAVTVGCAAKTVVGDVLRLIAELVGRARTLISISVAADGVPSFAVPASLSSDDESLTNAVPSARQNVSASSVST